MALNNLTKELFEVLGLRSKVTGFR